MKIRKLSVSELNKYVKNMLDYDPILSNVTVEGEVSNFIAHSSGHAYFSLKDEESKINCVMFNRDFSRVDFEIKDGLKVDAVGNVSIFIRDGKFQLYVKDLKEAGLGELHIKFEKLKKEFIKKGYFEDEFKKEIPQFPERIGIITSPEGAAIRDIISVFNRRTSFANCLIYPAHVQGDYAKGEIVEGIEYFNNKGDIDVIIVSRGGGSLEELWAFNEPEVVEAIFKSKIPVISGVGHETDFTLADFVSDLRAPTPSSAAEVALKSKENIVLTLNSLKENLIKKIKNIVDLKRQKLDKLKIENFIKNEMKNIENKYILLDNLHFKINQLISNLINERKSKLEKLIINLNHNNPINVINKGYSITYDKGDNVIKDYSEVEIDDIIKTRVKNGFINSKVLRTRKENQDE